MRPTKLARLNVALAARYRVERALGHGGKRLEVFDHRKSRVVELRFYGGLSVQQTADVLHVSPATVQREWRLAKDWLFSELRNKYADGA